jgi:indolepyruvate ferredoxin oxidoreductase alpha subunit
VGATIGDSTFFHAGIPPLINAVTHGAPFVLLILDNGTTAMTGHQPTPALIASSPPAGPAAADRRHRPGLRVEFIETGDPYNYREFVEMVKRAAGFAEEGHGRRWSFPGTPA